MDSSDIGQLTYLVILGVAVIGWFIAQNRNSLGKTAQQAMVWGLIFVGVIAGVGLWSDLRDDILPRQSVLAEGIIEVPRGPDGHYHLTVQVNGQPVRFVVDTGASQVVLSQPDARKVGLNPDLLAYTNFAQTANGRVATAPVRLDEVSLGGITDRGIRASVNGGEMDTSLLGMSYLNRYDRISIEDGKLVLER